MKISIMQPYFIPYGGYFRLFLSDLFVIYDDVQMISQGWVNRNNLYTRTGHPGFLTIPLMKYPLSTKIKDLKFAPHYKDYWQSQLRRFPVFKEKSPLVSYVSNIEGSPLEFIVGSLKVACEELSLPFNVVYSSSLGIPQGLKGQDRVIYICEKLGADVYVNSPGGRNLYNTRDFNKAGIELRFLPDYEDKDSILERDIDEVRKEIYNGI